MVLCCIAALVGNAAKVSFDFVNNTYGMTRLSGSTSDYNPQPTIVTDGGVTLTLDGGNNRLWSDGIRMYKYAYVIVSVGDANRITSISCETTGGTSFALTTVAELDELLLKPTTNTFSWNDANNKDLSEVKVKYTATSSNKAIKTLTIEYEPTGSVDPTVATPVFTIADSDWENEANGVVFKGASVTLSAPEGTPEGWIMGYKLNDGAEEYAEEAVTLTIDANTTVTAYINDEANAVTKTFTVAKIADLTVNPAFGAVIEGSTVEISTATEGALLHGFIGANTLEGVAMPYTFSVTEPTEVNVWAENPRYLDSEVLEGAYTIRIPSATPKWEAVTSVDQLLDGDIVTFTAKEYTGKASGASVTYPAVVMSGVPTSGTVVITAAEYDVELFAENEFSVEPFTFVIAKDDNGNITFRNADEGFLTVPNANAVSFSESAGTAFTVTFSSSDYAATVRGGGRSLRYNPNIKNPIDISSARFAFYTTGQQNVYMYRQLQNTPAAPARPTIDGIESDNDKLNLNVGDQLTVRCEEGSTIAYIEESLTPAAIAPRAASATAEWVNTGENPYTYTVQNLGTRLSFAAVKNGVYSEPSVLTISDSGITTGIEGIEAEAAEGAVEFFNLQGVKVNNPVNGLYIRRQGSKVEKVVVR